MAVGQNRRVRKTEFKSVDEILAIADHSELVWQMYLRTLEREESVGIDRVTAPERALLCTIRLEAEVNNGGFDQYFFNSSGNWAEYTTEALTAVGALHTAALFEKALAAFPTGKPHSDRQARWQQLDSVDAKILSSLDDEFYKEVDDLTELLYGYIQRQADVFRAAV
jgi:hypothetical protein